MQLNSWVHFEYILKRFGDKGYPYNTRLLVGMSLMSSPFRSKTIIVPSDKRWFVYIRWHSNPLFCRILRKRGLILTNYFFIYMKVYDSRGYTLFFFQYLFQYEICIGTRPICSSDMRASLNILIFCLLIYLNFHYMYSEELST